jgi:hypothetical protein
MVLALHASDELIVHAPGSSAPAVVSTREAIDEVEPIVVLDCPVLTESVLE